MKPVLKALVWLGLGGGIGFFAGYQLGYKKDKAEIEAACDNRLTRDRLRMSDSYDKTMHDMRNQYEEALDAIRSYKGWGDEEPTIGDIQTPDPEEDPEMPMDEPEMPEDVLDEDEGSGALRDEWHDEDEEEGEEEIPQLHPEDIRPYGISKDEFLRNEKGYDIVELDYYTDDSVIFDPKREEKWTHPEQLLGIGWDARFISARGLRDVVEVYIQNDTMETLYKITRIDDSFSELYEEE